MKKLLVVLLLIILLGSNLATYKVTKANTKPEKVAVKQYEEIVKYKYKLKEAEVKEKERLIIRIPFTKIGLSKDHIVGAIVWQIIKTVVVL